jgi:DNA repair protein RadA/Sms
MVAGQVILLAGIPGIGKSTILLQVAEKLSNTLYISGEESGTQIRIRADRLGLTGNSISIMEETNVDEIISTLVSLTDKPELAIVDSIQTLSTSDLSGMAGSVGQVRESAFRLTQIAKTLGIPLILVGQVTKEGSVAGPAALAHLVDTVCWFEGDKELVLRILRTIKNRFGPTDEVGVFRMEEKGLASIEDVERLFISERKSKVSGSVVSSIMEGSRPILVEIQSLVVRSNTPYPKRVAQGFDSRRLELLLAILTRRAGLPIFEWDVFVNVVGGISVREPAADLAVCLSLASSFYDRALPNKIVAIGEVGLLGEVREVLGQEKRIKQARRQGFTQSVSSKEYPYLASAIKELLKSE